jgi:hypothetical protein
VRDQSDHSALLLNIGDKIVPPKKRRFKFDTARLKNEEFLPKVEMIWEQPVNSSDPIDVLNIKLKRIKNTLMDGDEIFSVTLKKESRSKK